MAGAKLPKAKTPAQMKAEMAVGRARAAQEPVLSTEGKNALRLGDAKQLREEKTQYELAHQLAQERAALPIEEGGLGLPPDNTAMDRARAMGFDIDAYHGTINPDITAFDPMSGKGAREGTGSWFSENPQLASTYAGNMGGTIMPVLIKDRKFAVVDAEGKNWARLTPDTTIYHSNRTDTPASDLIENLFHDYTTTNDIARLAKQEGDKGVRFFNIKDPGARSRWVDEIPETADNLTVFDPTMVRGKFAAFDPFEKNSPDIMKAKGGVVKMADGGDPERKFIDQMKEEFSVYNKPTYGNEIPGTPSIDQQRYELTRQGQREAEGRSRMNPKDIAALAYPSAGIDALKTIGKSMVALPAYGAVNAFDWLQTGKMDPARAKQRGQQIEDWIAPNTQEGGELLEEIAKVGPAITGSEMGFGMHPNLWVSGIGMTTPKQTAAGLRLGKERVTPFAKDVGTMATELYESGKMPGMVSPNMFAVSPDGKPAKLLAPANEIGFYSPTEAAALNLQRKSGAGQAFLNDIMKGENVKSDEISAMGLDTFLKDKKNVTADEVRDYIAQNKLQIGEARYQDKPSMYQFARQQGMSEDDAASVVIKAREGDPEARRIIDDYANINITKFQQYQLPGGENYREIVLTLPSEVDKFSKRQTEIEQLLKNKNLTEEQKNALRIEYKESADKIRDADTYQSAHWDEPNALSHLRVSDRVTDGKKTLLVDEVQSDWHQQGREQGYNIKPTPEELTRISQLEQKSASGNMSMAERAEWAGLINKREGSIPDAPYKDDWYQLTLRRAIKEAIDGGYDRVALPTGSRVAERFDLSKQVDSIAWEKNPDGTYTITPEKDGNNLTAPQTATKEKLAGIIGKDVANKITSSTNNDGHLSGLDLQVGGEGMRKYYDEIYPGYLKKFGKKYGANTGKTMLDLDDGGAEFLHYMEITPAMRKEFSTGIPMKHGGKVQFAKSLDAMRHELTKAK